MTKYVPLTVKFLLGRKYAGGARILPTDKHTSVEADRPDDPRMRAVLALSCLYAAHAMFDGASILAKAIEAVIDDFPDTDNEVIKQVKDTFHIQRQAESEARDYMHVLWEPVDDGADDIPF